MQSIMWYLLRYSPRVVRHYRPSLILSVNDNDKPTSLLRYRINYGCNKFYNKGHECRWRYNFGTNIHFSNVLFKILCKRTTCYSLINYYIWFKCLIFISGILQISTKLPKGTAHLKNVNNCLNTNTYSYLETSCGQSSNQYINVVHFFSTSVNQILVAAKAVVFLQLCLICIVLLTLGFSFDMDKFPHRLTKYFSPSQLK